MTKPVRFKMIDNDNPFAIAEVIEEANIRSFRMNPQWVEIMETETSSITEEKQVQRKPRTPKKETVE